MPKESVENLINPETGTIRTRVTTRHSDETQTPSLVDSNQTVPISEVTYAYNMELSESDQNLEQFANEMQEQHSIEETRAKIEFAETTGNAAVVSAKF